MVIFTNVITFIHYVIYFRYLKDILCHDLISLEHATLYLIVTLVVVLQPNNMMHNDYALLDIYVK